MSTTMSTDNRRKAVIALHPFLPGAIAYIHAERAETRIGKLVIEDWLEQGLTIAKVTLAEAMAQLSLHVAARTPQPAIRSSEDHELPRMFLRQAD